MRILVSLLEARNPVSLLTLEMGHSVTATTVDIRFGKMEIKAMLSAAKAMEVRWTIEILTVYVKTGWW